MKPERPDRKRIRIQISGTVQGVGFRPFLSREAAGLQIRGWARNTSGGVEAEAEGAPEALDAFLNRIRTSPPPLARVESVSAAVLEPKGEALAPGFHILESRFSQAFTPAAPDTALCADCRQELSDPSDRRFRYPFINCTNCGPRYTIIRALPYDRQRTSMAEFPMCPRCRQEYEDIRSRRYHAQPDCCPDCGPRYWYADSAGTPAEGDPFRLAQQALTEGKILAVKGVGGFHLACRADDESAVSRLRLRKRRPARPLALMCRSLDEARRIADLSDAEARMLESPEAPIVLVSKKDPAAFSHISFSSRLGLMLPYSPAHVLLMDGVFGGPGLLVMTSANDSGCPVITDNGEALALLAGAADGFLLHSRDIVSRCDDSLVMEWKGAPYFFRRSRGYAPRPLAASADADGICAMGAELKGSFALGKEDRIFLSPHIGDLKNLQALEHYRQCLEHYRQLFRVVPSLLVRDLHPDYASSRETVQMGRKENIPVLPVQHHWAHMTSCMTDNRLEGEAFGIVWDGTGLGTDGSIWGAEFLLGGYASFQRLGSIRPISLAGGDMAVKEPGRTALALLLDAGLSPDMAPLPSDMQKPLVRMLASGVVCFPASSMGRLFDGVYALLASFFQASYDGEAAARLEALAPPERRAREETCAWPLSFYLDQQGVRRWDTRPLIRRMMEELHSGLSREEVAFRFMDAVCRMALSQTRALNPGKLPVVLSGGVFQNRFLLEGVSRLLARDGFTVYCHRQVSANDEGICLGQLAIASAYRRNQHVSGNTYEN